MDEMKNKTKFANTSMTKAMYDAITERAWRLRIPRSEYIRRLIRKDLQEHEAGNDPR
jgi:metal-responsive CopG/Arc/MetJ family transcriptional regulator